MLRSETQNHDLVDTLKEDHTQAKVSPQDRAMLDFVQQVTVAPSTVRQEDIDRLRAAGFTDGAIVDIVYVTAWFNFIDRVADALGVEPDPWHADEAVPSSWT